MRTMLMTAGLAMLLGQGTVRPGDIPRPDVWIKNAPNEPIPVELRDVHTDKPLTVLMINGEPSLAEARSQPMRVRVVPPVWSYRTITVKNSEDPAHALQTAGAEGWETTGLYWGHGQETVVLLKKPR
jgi:hypothetical protein